VTLSGSARGEALIGAKARIGVADRRELVVSREVQSRRVRAGGRPHSVRPWLGGTTAATELRTRSIAEAPGPAPQRLALFQGAPATNGALQRGPA